MSNASLQKVREIIINKNWLWECAEKSAETIWKNTPTEDKPQSDDLDTKNWFAFMLTVDSELRRVHSSLEGIHKNLRANEVLMSDPKLAKAKEMCDEIKNRKELNSNKQPTLLTSVFKLFGLQSQTPEHSANAKQEKDKKFNK